MCGCSLVYIISAGASPVFGFMVDRLGRNLLWVRIDLDLIISL